MTNSNFWYMKFHSRFFDWILSWSKVLMRLSELFRVFSRVYNIYVYLFKLENSFSKEEKCIKKDDLAWFCVPSINAPWCKGVYDLFANRTTCMKKETKKESTVIVMKKANTLDLHALEAQKKDTYTQAEPQHTLIVMTTKPTNFD